MNLSVSTVEDRSEAEDLLGVLERATQEAGRALFEDGIDAGTGRHYLERHFGRPEALLLVARGSEAESGREEVLGLAATAPAEDPLTGEVRPMLVALWVAPSIRHRGVARTLVQETRRRLERRGHRILTARAAHNDDAVISMGERWGLVRAWEVMSSSE